MKRLCEVCQLYFFQEYGWPVGHFFLCTSPMIERWEEVSMAEPEQCPEYKGRPGVDELREAVSMIEEVRGELKPAS